MSPITLCSTIAIIGGGFSGAMVATHLLRYATFPLSIQLVEPRPAVGLGLAYSKHLDHHLLNIPVGKTSVFPDDPDHFLRWLQTQAGRKSTWHSAVRADNFVPRRVYGEYVQSVLREASSVASDKVHLQYRNHQAQNIQYHPKGATVSLCHGEHVHADRVVLALGNFPSSDPQFASSDSYHSSAYIRDP
jgi:uncharacterized NAD(P)/FAD-binding protein YdhS